MRSFGTTVVMGVIAAISCGVAFYYYPRVETRNAASRVDQPLYEDTYKDSDVRSIKITEFDDQQKAIKKFELTQAEGSWVIPSKSNFLASNMARISAAVTSLKDPVILQEESEDQKDYEKYGVVEPDQQMGASGTGVGTLISLEDRNRQTIRDLIVGLPTRDGKRFVRVPGEPQIYVIDFDVSVLETDFHNWVDGNLLRLLTAQMPISWIEVNYYLIDAQALATTAKKKQVYRVQLKTDQQAQSVSIWLPDENQELPDEPSTISARANQQTFASLFRQLNEFQIQDVKRKNQVVAGNLANPKESDQTSSFRTMIADGFRRVAFENGQHQFDCVSGEVKIAFHDGVLFTVHIGNFAGVDISDQSKINRLMLVTAEVDETLVPQPKKPASLSDKPDAGEEGDASDQKAGDATEQKQQDAAKTEDKPKQEQLTQEQRDAQFQYEQELKLRESVMQKARLRVNAFNQLHADWIYVITEDAVRAMFPSSDVWVAEGAAGGN